MSKQTVIAYWLIPSEPAHSFFQQIINDLARRCDAPVFEPHVTIHVGAARADPAENALGDAARKCKAIGLTPLGIDQSRSGRCFPENGSNLDSYFINNAVWARN